MKLGRRVLTALIVGLFGIAMAVPASARDPKEDQSFTDKGLTSRMPNPGYRQPPLFYYRGQTFNVTFTLHNDSTDNEEGAKTTCLTLQVFRLPDFDAAIDRHETWLENNRDENQVLVFDGARETLTFAADETKTLTRGATLTADGYYQFDYGFCSDVPLVPKAGYEGPMVSGFVRVLGTAPVATPPPAATPTPSGSGVLGAGGAASASTLRLAATGSGAQQPGGVSWLGLLLWMGLLGAAGLGLALRRVR